MAHKDQTQKQKKIQFQTPKIIKITVWVVIGLLTALIVGSQVISWWNKRSAMAKVATIAAEIAARPVVKTCPEDLAKCEPCEGAKNFEWPLDKKGKPLPQLVVDVSATNCWGGYVITPKKVSYCIYPETDQHIQFQDGSIFLDGPARVNNSSKKRGIFRFMALKSSGKTTIEIGETRKIF